MPCGLIVHSTAASSAARRGNPSANASAPSASAHAMHNPRLVQP